MTAWVSVDGRLRGLPGKRRALQCKGRTRSTGMRQATKQPKPRPDAQRPVFQGITQFHR
ncbi:hypothetical protein K788_0002135 (plasmid) [Paraburkholderia caribensis MBA4]|uniref:Uncharacterized protein n=1 Tax=Paraburkholderia caribensis MBA4 TaxID=1323664 RepID=A0A0P0RPW3_9BURK|nr:hypothetical protein K788_0002135 [Paraburkholderia caribensis MBA4]